METGKSKAMVSVTSIDISTVGSTRCALVVSLGAAVMGRGSSMLTVSTGGGSVSDNGSSVCRREKDVLRKIDGGGD